MNKKNLLIYLFFIFVIIMVPDKVRSEEPTKCYDKYNYGCIDCQYKYKTSTASFEFTIKIRENEKGELKIYKPNNITNNSTMATKYSITADSFNKISMNSFTDDDDRYLKCPNHIYMKQTCRQTNSLGNASTECNPVFSFEPNDGLDKLDKSSEVRNNKLLIGNSNSGDKGEGSGGSEDGSDDGSTTKTCQFKIKPRKTDDYTQFESKEIVVTFDIKDGILSGEGKGEKGKYLLTFRDGITAADFGSDKECNGSLYLGCQHKDNYENNGHDVVGECWFAKTKNWYDISDTPINISNVKNADELGSDTVTPDDPADEGIIEEEEPLIVTCETIIGDAIDVVQTVFDWIKFLGPILLIVFGTMDFAGAVLQDNQDALKKATGNFVKRTIAAVAIFFLPLIVNIILGLPGVNSGLEEALCGIGKVVIK